MALENLIEKGILTELGIGNVGELCCSDCPDEDGESSTDGAGARCGDVRDDIENPVFDGVEILVDCDPCNCEVNANRAALYGAWWRENNPE